ncbi:molybdopterin-dependent oxidoreductase [Chloroflexota bacterium]
MRENTANQEPEERVIPSACRLCYGRCGILGRVKDGRISKIEGNPTNPYSQGTICQKAIVIPQLVHHPDRIKYPVKRTGRRGEGKWQRISWEEALDTIANKFVEIKGKYGAHTIFRAMGTGRDMDHRQAMRLLFNQFGSPVELCPGDLCYAGHYSVSESLFGDENQWTGADFDHAKCILIWGKALKAGGYFAYRQVIEAIERGAKLIVIDPRFTFINTKADVWLPVRPGTDVGLALGLLNVIIAEKLYDKDFVKEWTNGSFLVRGDTGLLLRESDIVHGGSSTKFMVWDEVSQSLRYWDAQAALWQSPQVKPTLLGTYTVTLADGTNEECKPAFQLLSDIAQRYTPAKVEEITWVPQDRIVKAARLYAQNSPGSCLMRGQRVEANINNSGNTHVLNILISICGNHDVIGGNSTIRAIPHRGFYLFPHEKMKGMQMRGWTADPYMDERFKYSTCPGTAYFYTRTTGPNCPSIVHAMATGKPYQPKALWVTESGVLNVHPDAKETFEAIKKLEFIVVVENFMTPIAELADIVLPAATQAEVDRIEWANQLVGYPAESTILPRQALVKPMWESKDDMDIYWELAKRMGVDFGWDSYQQWLDWALEPTGVTFDEFKSSGIHITSPQKIRRYETGELRFDGKQGFQTDSGKINLYSEALKEHGWGPLPYYIEPPDSPDNRPDLAKEYPLLCITGVRSDMFFHSEYRQVPYLRELHMFPEVEINPKTAAELGVDAGDWVWIESPRGRVRQKAVLTEGIHPKVISAQHHWWFPELPVKDELHGVFQSNINVLSSNDGPYDPATGSYQNSAFQVKVYRAEEGSPKGIITKPEELRRWLPEPTRDE